MDSQPVYGKKCRTCNLIKLKMQLCSRCKGAYYCCRECQVTDWPVHKIGCADEAKRGENLLIHS